MRLEAGRQVIGVWPNRTGRTRRISTSARRSCPAAAKRGLHGDRLDHVSVAGALVDQRIGGQDVGPVREDSHRRADYLKPLGGPVVGLVTRLD
jgi:hypothetical protein